MKILALLLLLTPALAFAGPNEKMIGLGVGAAYMSNNGMDVQKQGPAFELKGIYSIDTNHLNYDLGLGYQYSDLNGDLQDGRTIHLKTRAIYLEADAKYKFTKNFYFGPGVKVLAGTDVSFKQFEGDSSVNEMIGLKAQYDFLETEHLNYRIEASAYSSLQDPRVIIGLIGINLGFKEKQSSQSIISQYSPRPMVAAEKPVVLEEVSDIKIILKSARVLFQTDAYAVDPVLKTKLVKLAKYLNSDNSMWGRIKISGHTDNKGSPEHNKELSQKRANSIREVLLENGVDPLKVIAESYGQQRPIESNATEAGRAKNRRTEVEFFGIKNRDVFNKNIIEILQ